MDCKVLGLIGVDPTYKMVPVDVPALATHVPYDLVESVIYK